MGIDGLPDSHMHVSNDPAVSAVMVCSIFIASSTTRICPPATSSPRWTRTSVTVPGTGVVGPAASAPWGVVVESRLHLESQCVASTCTVPEIGSPDGGRRHDPVDLHGDRVARQPDRATGSGVPEQGSPVTVSTCKVPFSRRQRR